ncbi:unnamed protein product, partial [Allacma fusca]
TAIIGDILVTNHYLHTGLEDSARDTVTFTSVDKPLYVIKPGSGVIIYFWLH